LSSQTALSPRRTSVLFVLLSLVLHALVFLALNDARRPSPLSEPLGSERRMEISLVVEAPPEPLKETREEKPEDKVAPEETLPQGPIASVAEKPRREGEPHQAQILSTPLQGDASSQAGEAAVQETMVEPVSNPPSQQLAQGATPGPSAQKEEGQPTSKKQPSQTQVLASTTLQPKAIAEAPKVKPVADSIAEEKDLKGEGEPLDSADHLVQSETREADGAEELPPHLAFLQPPASAPSQMPELPLHGYGNMRQLDDGELAEVRAAIDGDDPDGIRWRVISQQLVKLEQRIYRTWNGQGKWPLDLGGVIRFQLTERGALQKVYVQLGSGRADFDQSLLEAIRRAIQQGTDETRHLAGMNYRYFRFQYNAAGRPRQSGELLPWERDKIVAGELGQNTDS